MITAQTYEADGQTKSITYANGVTTSFTYSPKRRWVERILTKNAGGTPLLDSVYARDTIGKILSITGLTAPDSWSYAYDDLDRLVGADNWGDNTLDETFTYDIGGNKLSRTRNPGAYVYPGGTSPRPHAKSRVAL